MSRKISKIRKTIPDTDGPVRKNRGGRPSVKASAQLTGHIVDRATVLFLRAGFEAVSIDMIAAEAAVSKRTFYTRFGGKADLFTAVVIRFVEQRMAGMDNLSAGEGSLADRLEAIAIKVLQIASEPDAIALDRVVTAEVSRFPELGQILYNFGFLRAIGAIETVLNQACAKGELGSLNTRHAAEHFLYAIVSGPMRLVVLGVESRIISGSRLKRLRQSVQIFLEGILPRSKGNQRTEAAAAISRKKRSASTRQAAATLDAPRLARDSVSRKHKPSGLRPRDV